MRIVNIILALLVTIPVVFTGKPVPPTWTQLTLPSGQSTSGGSCIPAPDGNLYCMTATGSSGSYVSTISRATQVNAIAGTWTSLPSITSSTCTHCGTENTNNGTIITSPNGTVFVQIGDGGTSWSDVLWCAASSCSAWATVTGYTGSSSRFGYTMAQDSSGLIYFLANNGDVWQENSANSTAFTNIETNPYTSSICGSQTAGSVYAMRILPSGTGISVGSGVNIMAIGEGNLLLFDTSFTHCSSTTYMTTGTGSTQYTGNGTQILYIPTANGGQGAILAGRATYTNNNNDLSSINATTGAVTNYICTAPVRTSASTGCIAWETNAGGGINSMANMHGDIVIWSSRETGGSNPHWVMESTNDGATWADISSGLGANCTGTNMEVQQRLTSYNPAHYWYQKCQSGKFYWVYGPV